MYALQISYKNIYEHSLITVKKFAKIQMITTYPIATIDLITTLFEY